MHGTPVKSASAFRPVATRRAFEDIASQIRERLAAHGLRSGDRLPAERQLAEQFHVSRNTLREALRSLEVAGLLELRKGATGGAFIREGGGEAAVAGMADLYGLGAIRPEHLTEARLAIGPEVVRLAAQRRSAADLAALEQNVAQAEAADRSGDFARRAALNFEFHRLLARATGNPVMIIVTDAMIEVTRRFVETIGPYPNRYVLPSRRKLLVLLRARNADGAAREMAAHLRRLQRYYLARHRAAQ